MAARLTVVFDDEELYRRAKIRAAEEGVPLKRIVEEALSAYVDGVPERPKKWTTGADILAWMDEMKARDEDPDGPNDLSDIKHYLYGYPKKRPGLDDWDVFVDGVEREARPVRYVAEERAPYNAGETR